MKFRRMREVYWLEASASVTRVIENVTPTTVIIEPAIVDSIPRAPSAPAPNMRGQRASHRSAPGGIHFDQRHREDNAGGDNQRRRNQKLVRRLLQNRLSLFMVQPSLCPDTRTGEVYTRFLIRPLCFCPRLTSSRNSNRPTRR